MTATRGPHGTLYVLRLCARAAPPAGAPGTRRAHPGWREHRPAEAGAGPRSTGPSGRRRGRSYPEEATSVEANKAVVRRWIEARNANDIEAAAACRAEPERAGLRRAFAGMTGAFPDVRITEEALIGEGDAVVLRWTFRAPTAVPSGASPPRDGRWSGRASTSTRWGRVDRGAGARSGHAGAAAAARRRPPARWRTGRGGPPGA